MEDGSSEQTEPSQGNKVEDTVTLARHEREKQGPWEAEVSYGGEADLHRHLVGCKKNPGHHKFIPVDQFNVDHLPPSCRHNDLVHLVRAMSELTVRVSVKYVSDSRPETVPGSDDPFPCYNESNGDMMRTGTGWVCGVKKYPEKSDKSYTTCKCKECVNSPTPKTQFAHIYICTAAHVVYDNLEAAHTTCHLFFDKGGRPDFCKGVVTLSGVSIVGCEQERDRCELRYVTHDLDLADKLDKIFTFYRSLSESVLFIKPLHETRPSPLTKQIPLDIRLDGRVRYYTCVSEIQNVLDYYKRYNASLRCDPCVSDIQLVIDNYNHYNQRLLCRACVFVMACLFFIELLIITITFLIVLVYLKKIKTSNRLRYDTCVSKMQGVLDYYKSLNDSLQDDPCVSEIQGVLDYYKSLNDNLQYYTCVSEIQGTLDCYKSFNDSLQYDPYVSEIQGVLDYYKSLNDSLQYDSYVSEIQGVLDYYKSFNDSLQYDSYVSEIQGILDYYKHLIYYYNRNMSERRYIHDPRNTLTIIVSHPHGCSKQVSVGHYTGLEGRNDGSAKFTYATPTCSGSSGAHVFVASSGFLGIIIDTIHSGGHCVKGQQLNFSIY